MKWIIYDSASGEIAKEILGNQANIAELNTKAGQSYMQSGDIDSFVYYVDISNTPNTLEEKTLLPFTLSSSTLIADGIDEITITGLPNPVTVTWPDRLMEEVIDGIIEFSVDQVGTYTITIEAIPYLTEVINVEAIPVS